MDWNAATHLLVECETNLRKLVAEAATDGDYSSVLRITDWAKAIAALATQGRPAGPLSAAHTANTAGATEVATRRTARRSSAVSAAPLGERRSRPSPADYPKFFRRGDNLMKVAWSKKDRKEYNHRAPRQTVHALAAAIKQVGAKGKLFNGDELLPLKDPADGASIPDYQAYVALAWLKHLGVVKQRGRRAGYTLVPDTRIDTTITAAWPVLPEWQG